MLIPDAIPYCCATVLEDELNTPQKQVVGFFALFQMCGVMVSGSDESTPSIIYHCVLRGLERLLLSEQLSRLDSESLVKLSVDRVNVQSPHRAMAALGLMLTCMYTGIHLFYASDMLGDWLTKSANFLNLFLLPKVKVHIHSELITNYFGLGKEKISPSRIPDANPGAPDSESVIVAMERVSVLFDR